MEGSKAIALLSIAFRPVPSYYTLWVTRGVPCLAMSCYF